MTPKAEFEMENTKIQERKISDLVNENVHVAEALHYLGIHFSQYSEKTWEEVCKERNLDPSALERNLNTAGLLPTADNLKLAAYPIEMLVHFLRHTHHIFIKHRLPYLKHLIGTLETAKLPEKHPAQDLQEVFPLFAEDFIVHVYEEEDSLFSYIDQLVLATKGKLLPGQMFLLLEKSQVQEFAHAHEVHDNEMEGLRQLTNNYTPEASDPLQLKVIYRALAAMEDELTIHANIENRILFPKALKLENEVKWHIKHKTPLG